MSAIYSNTSNQVAALKELYVGDDFMKDLVYKKNPLLALIPKDESPSGMAGKYIPVPLVYGTTSRTFSDLCECSRQSKCSSTRELLCLSRV